MALTYRAIATVTVGAGGASTVGFTSIPQTFTDLVVLLSLRASSGSAVSSYVASINGSGSYGGAHRMLNTDGGTVYSSTTLPYFVGGSGYTASVFTSIQVYIPNYASNLNKALSIEFAPENNGSSTALGMTSFNTTVTAGISAISFSCDNSFVQHSTATLYGISKP
jgi:hypothetical protein